jgi:hypothetical protein
VAALLLPMYTGVATAQITCDPVANRAGRTLGCFITAREDLGPLPRDSALYWHITSYPNLDAAAAAAAKFPRSTAVVSLGRSWPSPSRTAAGGRGAAAGSCESARCR